MILQDLQPKSIWKNFELINAVPRPSKKEERIIQFMIDFGKQLGLETETDSVGNVLIRKPATAGMEDRQTMVLQSHLDMVHQKNSDTVFDFETQGIQMYVDGDWVRAKGTTLGADNGLGVATIMSVLESTDLPNPAIEALFTIDEETGMTGALKLKKNWLKGTILLNLDTEDDDEIGVGCAGGIDISASKHYQLEEVASKSEAVQLVVKGLNGGHSGVDIFKGLGNANKILARLLHDLQSQVAFGLVSFDGGSLRNAIPREAKADLVCKLGQGQELVNACRSIFQEIKAEFQTVDPGLVLLTNTVNLPKYQLSTKDQSSFLSTLRIAHNGVYRMSPDIEGLVETSNNVARVLLQEGSLSIHCLTRSSVETSRDDLANILKATFETAGCEVVFSGGYPGWKPNMDSAILKVLVDLYPKLNGGEAAKVVAIHAGLECGILGERNPGMDMVSFGPTIKGAHSPDERASISSAQKYWEFFKEILLHIPSRI